MAGTSGTSGMANSVELVPNKKVDLREHVGHRVEITGTSAGRSKNMEEPGGQTGTSGGTSGTTGSGSQSGSMSGSGGKDWRGHKVKVESVRMISESCSGQ
jgi:hypothetical protein